LLFQFDLDIFVINCNLKKGIISGKKNETYDIRVKTIRDSFYHYFLITLLKMLKEI
jgi:hypothetical protein